MENPIYLTTPEAAARLRLKAQTLEGWRIRGEGPPYRKAGGRVLYLAADLDAWLSGRAFVSTAQAKAAGAQ